MKMKLILLFIIATITIISEGCKKPPIQPGNNGGTGNGNGSATGNPTNNKPPVANAGADQTITILTAYTTAMLNGSNSYDSSGAPIQFLWRQLSGPSNSSLPNPGQKECFVGSINTPGVYSFELKVWNTNGTDLDTTDISVSYPSYCQADRPEVAVGLTFLSDVPEQIQNPEIIAAGNKLIIPNWVSNATSTFSNNVYLYDRISHNWTTIQTSQVRLAVTTIAAGNKVFFAGGVSNWDYNYTSTSVVDIYDITTNTWSVSNLSEARGYCTAVVSGNKIFFAGGLKSNNALSNKVDIYDLESNTWSSTLLPGGARQVGAAIAAQNKVLFCGGYTVYEDPTGWGLTFTTPSAVIDVYDNNTGLWSAGTMQLNKVSFAAIGLNEKVYFAGGVTNDAATFHVEELNVNTMNSSSSCLHQPMVCFNGKSAVVKNELVIFFTYSPFYGIERNKFDIYNMQTGLWSVGVLPLDLIPPGVFSSIVSVNNEIYAVIGTKLYKMNL